MQELTINLPNNPRQRGMSHHPSRGGQRRASFSDNQPTTYIKQLPRGGSNGYLITKEQGLCFVHYLCNRPPSSIGNLFIQCRCRFNPMSFSQALVLLSSFSSSLTSRYKGSSLSARIRRRHKGSCFFCLFFCKD